MNFDRGESFSIHKSDGKSEYQRAKKESRAEI